MLNLNDYERLETIPRAGSERDHNLKFRSRVPEGSSGPWRIEKFNVEVGIGLLREMRDGRGTPPGTYTRLVHKSRGIVMSDTDAEIGDMRALRGATGRVLIHGLGLGIALQMVLQSKSVAHVDVVEIDGDVLSLVSPHFVDDRIVFHNADCREKKWPKGTQWDCVWHDIWDSICDDNKKEMSALKRSFCRRCRWQHCWAEEWIR